MTEEIQTRIAVLQDLYKDNGDFIRYFVDWRHKVMLRYMVSFATSILLLKVLLDHDDLVPTFVWLAPALLISISSLVALALDQRNETLIEQGRLTGEELEKELFTLAGFDEDRAALGAYYRTIRNHGEGIKYGTVLKTLYLSTAILFLLVYILGTIVLYDTKGVPHEVSANPPASIPIKPNAPQNN